MEDKMETVGHHMRMRFCSIRPGALGVIVLLCACGSSDRPAGSEGGRCYRNGTCDGELTCLSELCVRLESDLGSDEIGQTQDLPTEGGMDLGALDLVEVDGPDTAEVPVSETVDGSDDDENADHEEAEMADQSSFEVDACVIACTGRQCGDDGCGGSCGTCVEGERCEDGACLEPEVSCSDGMCLVPAAIFWMGANIDGTQCPTNGMTPLASATETPCHQVTVPAFLIDRLEVTASDYRIYVEAKGPSCENPADGKTCIPATPFGVCSWDRVGREMYPITCLTSYQAEGYCAWTGKRLCTEAEWEFAARGTDGRIYPWGNEEPTCEHAVIHGSASACVSDLLPVGSRPLGISPFGVLDMAGNADEWVADWYQASYVGAPVDGSARAREQSDIYGTRVRKGCSVPCAFSGLRASLRSFATASQSSGHSGFRCCRTPGL